MPEGLKKQTGDEGLPEGEDGFGEARRRVEGQLLVRSRIEMIRKQIGRLPRKGAASVDETAEERRLLKNFSRSLKPAKLPSDLLESKDAPRPQEGVTLFSTVMDDPEGWEEEWKE